MVNSVSNYESWISSLNARGIKTTSLGKGEANFADYTNALSDSLKQDIAASFDNDADYDLQAKLASLLGGKNLMQSRDIKSILGGSGISYSVQYVKTAYIPDNKADGHYDKNVTNGSIAVYTFKDANGGEIKIADANGNGALESEELFMNEILSGVVSDISAGSGASGMQNTQNNMQNQLDALLEEMNNRIAEQQKMFEEQMLKMREAIENATGLDFAKDKKTEENKTEAKLTEDDSSKSDTKDLEDEAEKIINRNYPGLTQAKINLYMDEIIELVSEGKDLKKAIETVIGDSVAA